MCYRLDLAWHVHIYGCHCCLLSCSSSDYICRNTSSACIRSCFQSCSVHFEKLGMCYFLDVLLKGKLCSIFSWSILEALTYVKNEQMLLLCAAYLYCGIKCLFLRKLTSTCFDIFSIRNLNTCQFNQSLSVRLSPVRNETFMLRKFQLLYTALCHLLWHLCSGATTLRTEALLPVKWLDMPASGK